MELLLYCTRNNKKLFYDVVSQKYMYGLNGKNDKFNSLNGKIVAECDYYIENILYDDSKYYFEFKDSFGSLRKSCLSFSELDNYLKGKDGYAIHIKNLNIFDNPRELKNYKTKKEFLGGKQVFWKELKNGQQNMMYCYGNNTGEKYILISIRPEWLCKILNGEKTIEVRKKVLKEMLGNETR